MKQKKLKSELKSDTWLVMVEIIFHSHFSNSHKYETKEEYKMGTHNLGTPGPGTQDVESDTPETQDVGRGGSTWDPKSEVCEVKEAELVY